MRISAVSKQNLKRDRRVLGKQWAEVYGNYFSDKRNLKAFVKASKIFLKQLPKNYKVLYVCSGTGLLGEYVCNYLRKIGKKPALTIVDASLKQLKENKNPHTRKIVGDALYLQLGEKFDLVIMRSALHYFPSAKLQVKVLKHIARHLAPRGVFINQCVTLSSEKERDLANKCRPLKMGKRRFLSPADIRPIYTRAGLTVKLIGYAPPIVITSQYHVERYGLLQRDVRQIMRLIARVPESLRPNVKLTKVGYLFYEEFPIYASRTRG